MHSAIHMKNIQGCVSVQCVCIQLVFFLIIFLLQKEHAYRISFIGLASWDPGNKIYVHADELVTPLHHTQ